MAVKVVSASPIKTYRVCCSKCFYELEYTPIDIRRHTHTDYGGGSDDSYHITCPREECKSVVEVKKP